MDELVLKRAQNGDVQAFEILIEEFQKLVYNVAIRMMRNRQDALDASQDTFIKIYSGLKSFRGQSTLSSWIYRITINCCKDMLRKKKNNGLLPDEENFIMSIQDESLHSHPEKSLENKESRLEIERALMSLEASDRAVIILRDVRGLKYEEISEILELNIGTVKSRINRARIKLQKHLSAMEQ